MRRKTIFRLPAPSTSAIEAISAVCCKHWAAAKAGSPLPWWLARDESWLALDFAGSPASRSLSIHSSAPTSFGG
jgi:hypothetical protein